MYYRRKTVLWQVAETENLAECEQSELLPEFGFLLQNKRKLNHAAELCQESEKHRMLWQVAETENLPD